MGLIDEYVEVELCSGNMKYYENLGYKIPKVKNLSGMWTTPRGTKIKVISKDLKKTSDVLVHAKCDACGEIIEISFNGYCNNIKRNSGKTLKDSMDGARTCGFSFEIEHICKAARKQGNFNLNKAFGL